MPVDKIAENGLSQTRTLYRILDNASTQEQNLRPIGQTG